MKDYYHILGLPFGAPSSAIKSAYRKLAFRYHPDKNLNNKAAEDKFIEITEAYSILSDADKLAYYHLLYAEFIKLQQEPKKEIPQPKVKVHPFYEEIVKKHHRPVTGKASPRGIEWNIYNVGAIAVFSLFIVFLLVYSMVQMHEQEQMRNNRTMYYSTDSLPPKQKYHMTRDEYYRMVSEEFQESQDSTLMKIKNVDSMIRVLDSINILNQ